jgi:tetratricopeptide (TPR) repeat protein
LWHDYAFLDLITNRQVEAEIFICKSLYARKRILGKGSVGLVKSYILFGNVFQDAGKPIRAEKAYVKAITISNLYRGPHIDTGTAYLSLASLYTRQNEPEHALKNVKTGYKMLKPYLDSTHADRANAYTLLAAVFADNGKQTEALRCWDHAQKIYATSLPDEHDYVKLAKAHILTPPDLDKSPVPAPEEISSDSLRG